MKGGTLLHPRLRRVRRWELGAGVTIGIAAICSYGHAIILASDRRISSDDYSGDVLRSKIAAIHPHWALLLAGDDLTHTGPISHAAYSSLHEKESASLDEVANTIIREYRHQFRVKVDAFLSRFGMDLDSFKREGAAVFGEVQFSRHMEWIERLDIGCEFLVAGYGPGLTPHIFEVQNPGEIHECYPMSFAAIGSGANSALSTLYFHQVDIATLLERAIYHVCEAKFMVQRAEGVGTATTVVVLRLVQDERDIDKYKVIPSELSEEFVEEIRAEWERRGQPRLPDGFDATIKANLGDAKKFCRVLF